jgi:cell division protein FtsX
MPDQDTERDLRAALYAEYEEAHGALVPDGVAAVLDAADRARRRLVVGMAAVAVLAVLAGVVSWRLFAPGPPPQQQVADGCPVPGFAASVFFKINVTDAELAAVEAALRDSAEVHCLRFESKEEAWERFKRQFADAPDLVNATRPEDLPMSFRFRVTGKARSDAVESRVGGLPGVSDYVCSCTLPPS